MYRSFVSLGRYTPKYFILFVAIVNGIVSLISLSVFSLLVYRNARDFCVCRWILYGLIYQGRPLKYFSYKKKTAWGAAFFIASTRGRTEVLF